MKQDQDTNGEALHRIRHRLVQHGKNCHAFMIAAEATFEVQFNQRLSDLLDAVGFDDAGALGGIETLPVDARQVGAFRRELEAQILKRAG